MSLKKIQIDLFKNAEERYEKDKSEFIVGYSKHVYSFFGGSRKVKRSDIGKAEWDKMFPDGFNSWILNSTSLNTKGQQILINKINEIIEHINSNKLKK